MAGEMWFDWNREIRTAEDWDTCGRVMQLIEHVREAGGCFANSKRLHFETACCRRIWHLLQYPQSRDCVETAERVACGELSNDQLDHVREAAIEFGSTLEVERRYWERPIYTDIHDPAYHAEAAAFMCCDSRSDGMYYKGVAYKVACAEAFQQFRTDSNEQLDKWWDVHQAESCVLANLFRDVMGNPFRPVRFLPEWRSSTVVGVARQMYDSRAFCNMPILADALEDAGCDEPAILDHCREPREHIRGCWVVDLALGLEDPPVLHPTK